MYYFYLITNVNRNEPEIIKSYSYIHVKARKDANLTLIITKEEINYSLFENLSQEEAQILVDSWIDEENINPELDIDGNELIQSKINLNWYLK